MKALGIVALALVNGLIAAVWAFWHTPLVPPLRRDKATPQTRACRRGRR